jgi:hypothetical protein
MRKMINKEIGVSVIALALVIVSLFNATNIYADSYYVRSCRLVCRKGINQETRNLGRRSR